MVRFFYKKKGDGRILLPKGSNIFPSLAKRGKGRFYKYSCSTPGFTLIEVLIAVTLLSVILAAIYSTFFLSHKAIEGMDEYMLKMQEARKALDILRCEIEAVFYKDKDSDMLLKLEDRDIYGKQAAHLTFTAFSALRPSLSRISYYIADQDGKLTLFKKIESYYANENNSISPPFNSPLSKGGYRGVKVEMEESSGDNEWFDIIEGIEAFTIEAKFNDKWVKTWDTEINKDIPQEIRISLTVKLKNGTITLFDVAKPRIGRQI